MIKKLFFLAGLVVLFNACRESSSVGTGLLEEERLDIQYADDFNLTSEPYFNESVTAYTDQVSNTIFSVGSLNDPLFGHRDMTTYTGLRFNPNLVVPDFAGSTLDSIVLVLTYDTLGNYGDKSASHLITVHALNENPDDYDTLYTSDQLTFDPTPIGTAELVPNPNDSISIINPADTSVLALPAQLRIRMGDDWAQELFSNPSYYEDEESLSNYVQGLVFKSIPSASSVFGINMGSTSNGDSGLNRLTVYYADTSNTKRQYTFRLTTFRGQFVDVDRQSTFAQQVIDGTISSDSLLLVEPYHGYLTKITIDDLSEFTDKIINHANLRVYLAELEDDNEAFYPPIFQMLTFEEDIENQLVKTRDVSDVENLDLAYSQGFKGGVYLDDNGDRYFEMNVTKRIKDMVEGGFDSSDNEIIIGGFSPSQLPRRNAIYGAKHSTYPIRLEILYTEQ